MAEQKRGRPPLTPGQTPAKIQVYVAPADYDRAFALARREAITIPEVLRRGLRRVLQDDERGR